MNLISVDVGQARIGLAYNVGALVLAHGVVPRDTNAAKVIADVAIERSAGAILIGLPFSLDGSETASTINALAFAREVAGESELPILLIDERLTTVSAANSLRSAGKTARESKSIIDAESARVILEAHLSGAKAKPLEEFDAR